MAVPCVQHLTLQGSTFKQKMKLGSPARRAPAAALRPRHRPPRRAGDRHGSSPVESGDPGHRGFAPPASPQPRLALRSWHPPAGEAFPRGSERISWHSKNIFSIPGAGACIQGKMATRKDFVGFALKQGCLHRGQVSLQRGAPKFGGPWEAARRGGTSPQPGRAHLFHGMTLEPNATLSQGGTQHAEDCNLRTGLWKLSAPACRGRRLLGQEQASPYLIYLFIYFLRWATYSPSVTTDGTKSTNQMRLL